MKRIFWSLVCIAFVFLGSCATVTFSEEFPESSSVDLSQAYMAVCDVRVVRIDWKEGAISRCFPLGWCSRFFRPGFILGHHARLVTFSSFAFPLER